MVADEFLWQVSAQVKCSAERKELEWTGGAVKRGSTGGDKKERSLWPGRNESGSLNVELPDGMNEGRGFAALGKGWQRCACRELGTAGLSWPSQT